MGPKMWVVGQGCCVISRVGAIQVANQCGQLKAPMCTAFDCRPPDSIKDINGKTVKPERLLRRLPCHQLTGKPVISFEYKYDDEPQAH